MKRFTETNKWRDPWFRKLSAVQKLAFIYLVENCDEAGVWDPDYELANFSIGAEVDWDKMMQALGPDRLLLLDNGSWFLTKFLEFQCGPVLRPDCRPHVKILSTLREHGIEPLQAEDANSVHLTVNYRVCHTLSTITDTLSTTPDRVASYPTRQDKDKTKTKTIGESEGPEGSNKAAPIIELPLLQSMPATLDTPQFREAWDRWINYRKQRKFPTLKPASVEEQLRRLVTWGHDSAIQSISDSIANGYQGLFPPKHAVAGASSGSMSKNRYQQAATTAEEHAAGFFAEKGQK